MITKASKIICGCLVAFGCSVAMTSCEDFFDQESDHVLYDNVDHLNNAVDTLYSVAGIMKKMQSLADRTILLGEVRGDLVDLTTDASADLRQLATFSATSENVYNQPRDYYAVINNCNYFIAHADTALKSNRNESIFMREWAAVKAFRAWTYLQLVLNYGRVPFVTEPILTKEQSEQDYPMYTLTEICQYFISDLSTIPERYNTEFPQYLNIHGVDSRLFYFPLSIVRAELYLWLASATQSKEYYRQAALNYYKYISERNGLNSEYPVSTDMISWTPGSTTWLSTTSMGMFFYDDESFYADGELITMIAGDSIRAQGNYSELRNLFNSNVDNEYKPSITPSQALVDLSAAQVNCCLSSNGTSVTYAPDGLSQHRSGDLRLYYVWTEGYRRNPFTNEMTATQSIDKYYSSVRNVHLYRRTMLYIRMAEALNQAGYPRMAFSILSTGINNSVIQNKVMPYYSLEDSVFLAQFDFPINRYGIADAEAMASGRLTATQNTIGIHSRGSGWTPLNEYYRLPNDTLEADSVQQLTAAQQQQIIAEQQLYVDSLLLDENALEFCFEGTRYYDLMRFAMRSSNPGKLMTDHIYARRGKNNAAAVRSEIQTDLSNPQNWYLRWNGKLGF